MIDLSFKTCVPLSFMDHFFNNPEVIAPYFKPDFGIFFIVKIQEMLPFLKEKVPPSRGLNNILVYLKEGKMKFNIGSESYVLSDNNFIVLPAGQVYSFENSPINKGFICNLSVEFLTYNNKNAEALKSYEFFNIWGNPFVTVNEETTNKISHLLEDIFKEYNTNGLNNVTNLNALFIKILNDLNAFYIPLNHNQTLANIQITNKFKSAINQNIDARNNVSTFASLLNISANHLNKTIKQVTGKTASSWIIESLILESKVLLVQPQFSIQQIAEKIGFEDQSYFSRVFKKNQGVTPTEYRNRHNLS